MNGKKEKSGTQADVNKECTGTPIWAVYARGYDAQVSHTNFALESKLYATLCECLNNEDIEQLIYAIQTACRKHVDAKTIFANLLSRSEFQPPDQDEPGGTFYVRETRYERVGIRYFNGHRLRAILWYDDIIGPEFEFKLAQLFAKEIITPSGYIFRRAKILTDIVCKEGAKYLSKALAEKAYGRHSLAIFCQRIILNEGKKNPQLLYHVAQQLAVILKEAKEKSELLFGLPQQSAVSFYNHLCLRLYQAIPASSPFHIQAQTACRKITAEETGHSLPQQRTCTAALVDMVVMVAAEALAENVTVTISAALREGLMSLVEQLHRNDEDYLRVIFFLKLAVLAGHQTALLNYIKLTHVKVVEIGAKATTLVRKEYAARLKSNKFRIDDNDIVAGEITDAFRLDIIGMLLRERLTEYVLGQSFWFDLRQILSLYTSYKLTKNINVDRANIALTLAKNFQGLTKEGLVENFRKLAESIQRLGEESLKQLHAMVKAQSSLRAQLLQHVRARLISYILEDSTDNMVNIFQFFYWLLPSDPNDLFNVMDTFTRYRTDIYTKALEFLRAEVTKQHPDFTKIYQIYHRLNDLYETSREFNITVSIYELPADCKNLQIEYLYKLNAILRQNHGLEYLHTSLRALLSLNRLCLDVQAGCSELTQKLLCEIDWRALFSFLLKSDPPSVIIALLSVLKPLITPEQFTQLVEQFVASFCDSSIQGFPTICTWLTALREISQEHVLAEKLRTIRAQQPQLNRTAVIIHLGLHAGMLVGTSEHPVQIIDDDPEPMDIATAKLACVFVDRLPPCIGLGKTTIRQSQFRHVRDAGFSEAQLYDVSFVQAELTGYINFKSACLELVSLRDIRIGESCVLDFTDATLINVDLCRMDARPFPVRQIKGFNSDDNFSNLLFYNCELFPRYTVFTTEQLQNAFWNLVKLLAHFGNLTTRIVLYDLIENGMTDYLTPSALESYQTISTERKLFSKPARASRWQRELAILKGTIATQLRTDAAKRLPTKIRDLLPEDLKILLPKRSIADYHFVPFSAAETILAGYSRLTQERRVAAAVSSPVAAVPAVSLAAMGTESLPTNGGDTNNSVRLQERELLHTDETTSGLQLVNGPANAVIDLLAAPVVIPIPDAELVTLEQLEASFLQQPPAAQPKQEATKAKPQSRTRERAMEKLKAARAKRAAQTSSDANNTVLDSGAESTPKLNDARGESDRIEPERRSAERSSEQNVNDSRVNILSAAYLIAARARLRLVSEDEINTYFKGICASARSRGPIRWTLPEPPAVPPQSPSFHRVVSETPATGSLLSPPSSSPSK